MKPLPTVVRQLAEKHARYKGQADKLETRIADLHLQLAKVCAKRDATGLLLVRIDERVQLDAISRISGHTRYGKRGTMTDAMLEILRASGVQWVTTTQLRVDLQRRFKLTFEHWSYQKPWVDSMKSTLRRLEGSGTIERSRAGPGRTDLALWRIKQGTGGSLSDLRALAAQVAQTAEG